MTPKTEQERIELYERIFVSQKEIGKILDRHGKKISEDILKQLKPELEGIHLQMTEGRETFIKQNDEIKDLQVDLESHKASPHPITSQDLTPSRSASRRKKRGGGGETITKEGVKKRFGVIIAIIGGLIIVVATLIIGIFYIASLFPW